jgi:hypothetical protein
MVNEIENPWICEKCKEKISDTDKFCKHCGESIDIKTEITWLCDKCEEEVSENDLFCKTCGNSVSKKMLDDKTEKTNEIIPNTSSGIDTYLVNGLVLVVFFIMLGFIVGFFDVVDEPDKYVPTTTRFKTPSPTPQYTPQLTEKQKKTLLIETIAKNYYDTHSYQDNNVFDCDNMAQDVWDMLKAKGINAKIQIGNIELSPPITLKDVNHAWVLAEIEPDSYLAVETTGGYIVYGETNPNYYTGFSFKDPKNYRSFTELYKTSQFQYADYTNYWTYYTDLINQYNNADALQQRAWKSGMDVAKTNLEEKKRRFEQTQIELNALLEYG